MKREAIDPRELIEPRCDYHLANWAEWMQGYEVGIGYRHRSAGLENRTSATFDDLCERMDREHAKAINAIVSGLPLMQNLAIRNVYLGDVWRSARHDMAEVFLLAAAEVWKLAQKRGLS